jgi:hypothetical protein
MAIVAAAILGFTFEAKTPIKVTLAQAAGDKTFSFPEAAVDDFQSFSKEHKLLSADNFELIVVNDGPFEISPSELKRTINSVGDLLKQKYPQMPLQKIERYVFYFSHHFQLQNIGMVSDVHSQNAAYYGQFFTSHFPVDGADGLASIRVSWIDGKNEAVIFLATGLNLTSWDKQRQWYDGRTSYGRPREYAIVTGREAQHVNLVHEIIHSFVHGVYSLHREDEKFVYGLDIPFTREISPSVLHLRSANEG